VDLSLSPGIRNLRAILVGVDGKTMVERYYDSNVEETADVASVTKSIVSTLVGIAVSEGDLTLDQTLSELLPSYADVMTSPVGAITVRQLLTMTAGLPEDGSGDPRPSGSDWVAEIVQRGAASAPGQGFAYSSVSSHLLAAVLTEATGLPLLTYAREKLFDPLGIDTRPAFQPILAPGKPNPVRAYDKAGFAWPRDPQGINIGYGSIKMSAQDMLKLGNLYLAKGAWEGEQLLPSGWVEDATSPTVSTANGFGGAHYGYQWWVTQAGEHPAFAAIGYGGQIIEVVPDLRLVVVASTWIDDTSGFDSRTWETMIPMVLVPAFEPDPR
jgi:CubicO group peptidase (beta-lactamase class C family)